MKAHCLTHFQLTSVIDVLVLGWFMSPGDTTTFDSCSFSGASVLSCPESAADIGRSLVSLGSNAEAGIAAGFIGKSPLPRKPPCALSTVMP